MLNYTLDIALCLQVQPIHHTEHICLGHWYYFFGLRAYLIENVVFSHVVIW